MPAMEGQYIRHLIALWTFLDKITRYYIKGFYFENYLYILDKQKKSVVEIKPFSLKGCTYW